MEEKPETGLVKYTARDGQSITLGFKIVREYLVHGKKEKVTPQELMFYMATCKSMGLNPFKRDAYLIKYSEDPAAIVTSIAFYRSRAKAAPDCRGWKKGIALITKEGKYIEREGAILIVDDGEKLVGGWFRAKPAGWDEEFHHNVNLRTYIKKKSDGTVTQFWAPEKQPDQIMKVAEVQGLRTLWPDLYQQLYSEEEILAATPDTETAMKESEEADKEARLEAIEKFNSSIPQNVFTDDVKAFVELTAKANRKSAEEVMIAAVGDVEGFWGAFRKWEAKQSKSTDKKTAGEKADANPKEAPKETQARSTPPPSTEKKPEEGPTAAGGSINPNRPQEGKKTASSPKADKKSVVVESAENEDRLVNCPDDVSGQKFAFYCQKHCAKRKGCPSWPLE